MAEISSRAIDSFRATGGILGLVILSLVVLILVLLYGVRWYIKTQREHETEREKFHAEQYNMRLEVERQLADNMNLLVMTIRGRPCQKGSTEAFSQGTRRLERGTV